MANIEDSVSASEAAAAAGEMKPPPLEGWLEKKSSQKMKNIVGDDWSRR
jgi:hypothetical protein